jgi:hypothetical protein
MIFSFPVLPVFSVRETNGELIKNGCTGTRTLIEALPGFHSTLSYAPSHHKEFCVLESTICQRNRDSDEATVNQLSAQKFRAGTFRPMILAPMIPYLVLLDPQGTSPE